MSAPTLINLPPPPSNPETPSEMGPGTPNSGTTSLSALSTIAIKDGHRGHPSAHVNPPGIPLSASRLTTNLLEAERADRISRLAGLERVAAVRTPGGSTSTVANASVAQPQGYFDAAGLPAKERSTVGSASATGSVGGRTTWASSSDIYDADKMSEGPDDGDSSVGALSDEGNASLVGFGEGASSTLSGPVSSASKTPQRPSGAPSPSATRSAAMSSYLHSSQPSGASDIPSSPVSGTPMASARPADQQRLARSYSSVSDDGNLTQTEDQEPWETTGHGMSGRGHADFQRGHAASSMDADDT